MVAGSNPTRAAPLWCGLRLCLELLGWLKKLAARLLWNHKLLCLNMIKLSNDNQLTIINSRQLMSNEFTHVRWFLTLNVSNKKNRKVTTSKIEKNQRNTYVFKIVKYKCCAKEETFVPSEFISLFLFSMFTRLRRSSF